MFNDIVALICNILSLMSISPVEDIMLILSAGGVAVVFCSVMLARALRRRVEGKTE